MANEVQSNGTTGKTLYFLVRNSIGQIWNTVAAAFQTYATVTYGSYTTTMTEQGTASSYFAGTFPSAITAGTYSVVVKEQAGGSPAETDRSVAGNNFEWNGTGVLPLSDLSTSGQVGQIGPLRPAKGVMLSNFPIYFKSAADHVTPFTSGVVSGQIRRDGGAWGTLQSGTFTERGNGAFDLQALTSGDLNGYLIQLLFTANGISGGSADPVCLTVLTQRVSGAT